MAKAVTKSVKIPIGVSFTALEAINHMAINGVCVSYGDQDEEYFSMDNWSGSPGSLKVLVSGKEIDPSKIVITVTEEAN